MLEFNRLVIDGLGSGAVEYRIEDGRVESRTLRNGLSERPWLPVTPEKLRFHVMADTALSRWLSRRMGIHRLIRACQDESSFFAGNEPSMQKNQQAA